jgi:hypothetical protein
VTFALLSVLALIDAGFAGFRDAAGRDPRVFKWRDGIYPRAIVRGLIAGVIAQLVVAALVGTPALLLELGDDYRRAADAMLWVLVPYTLFVLGAFIPYFIPSIEVRTLVSVIVFGPCTLARPLVMLAAAIAAMITVPRPAVCAAVAVAVGVTVLLEPALGALRTRGR